MFLYKQLSDWVFGENTNATTSNTTPESHSSSWFTVQGSLYLVTSSTKVGPTLMFPQSELNLAKENTPWNYSLCITRVVEDQVQLNSEEQGMSCVHVFTCLGSVTIR
jgi:hypothetical protein